MRATYTTRCPECDEPIQPGDQITSTEDSQWVHRACVNPDGAEVLGTYAFCPDCGLELPTSGVCDCTKETGR